MINFDALTLKAFIRENYDYLKNASVRKIQQPSRREVVMHLRNNGENRKLYININPEFFHICFLQDIQLRNITIPDAAPMFCMLLRKYIMNSKIIDIIQPFGERILELYFNYSDALGEMTSLCLAIELMGKYSNIVLYNKKILLFSDVLTMLEKKKVNIVNLRVLCHIYIRRSLIKEIF